MNTPNKSLFRKYDIRGIYQDTLSESDAELVGKALGTHLVRQGLKSIVVGQDNRPSSEPLTKSLVKGLLSTGINVTDTGIAMTPLVYFYTSVKPFDAGVMVSGSHNPANHNGIKMCYKKARPLFGDEIIELYDLIKAEDFEQGEGQYEEQELFPLYLEYLKKSFSFSKDTQIVINAGNGTAAYFAPKIFKELGCVVVELDCEPDSSYPNGVPNPERVSFMKKLSDKVNEVQADMGFGFDTDVDRFGVVDENGKVYSSDKLLFLYSEDILEGVNGATIVYDVKCTELLKSHISSLGGVPKMMQTGHVFFKEALRAGAVMGAEFSGHMYFGGSYFGFDDGIYAACKFIEIYESRKGKVSEILGKYPTYYHSSEIKIPCPDEIKMEVIDRIVKDLMEDPSIQSVANIDGARVNITTTGWFLIRASNTSAKLTAMVEGVDEAEANEMVVKLKNILQKYDGLDLSNMDKVEIHVF